MNSSSASNTYERCYQYYRANREWAIYLAQIIPKAGIINKPWTISGRTPNDNIRVIDGASLYEMVTEEKDALRKIYLKIINQLEQLNLEISPTQIKMILDAYDSCYH